ncbi:MAG: sulfite exporter TauE/SafE family protein [Candidatus Omnitrophica bacterium]|nr:sulfite exporter TauE/SafE family protein [Candidatus Omnitrophota bacterium]
MIHNIYYLFISGIILGSGPCLSFCAPLLTGYSVIYNRDIKNSSLSYLIFSICKIISYMILAVVWVKIINLFSFSLLSKYSLFIYKILAIFIILIGIATLFYKKDNPNRICQIIHKKNIKNIAIMGFLVGFSPCLPLFGILNYIAIISNNPAQTAIYSIIFGIGTTISPLLLIIVFTAKISEIFSKNKKINKIIKIIGGLTLIILGLIVIL